jgi:hypothetical protein
MVTVDGVRLAVKQTFCLHCMQDPRQAGQQQAGGVGNGGLFQRTAFVQHPQDPPFLLVYIALRQHLADRSHDGFAGAQKGDGKRTLCAAEHLV